MTVIVRIDIVIVRIATFSVLLEILEGRWVGQRREGLIIKSTLKYLF
jgi:hypothetical protein